MHFFQKEKKVTEEDIEKLVVTDRETGIPWPSSNIETYSALSRTLVYYLISEIYVYTIYNILISI